MNITFIRRLPSRVLVAAATAVILSAGAATTASATNDTNIQNPFGPKVPFTPPARTVPGDQDRPFGNPPVKQKRRYKSVSHYLLGIWNGRLKNGAVVRISFSRDGKFSLINVRRGIAQVGYWRVQGLKIQLIAVGQCNRGRCVRYPQQKRVVFAIKPLNANAMRTPGGSFRRA